MQNFSRNTNVMILQNWRCCANFRTSGDAALPQTPTNFFSSLLYSASQHGDTPQRAPSSKRTQHAHTHTHTSITPMGPSAGNSLTRQLIFISYLLRLRGTKFWMWRRPPAATDLEGVILVLNTIFIYSQRMNSIS